MAERCNRSETPLFYLWNARKNFSHCVACARGGKITIRRVPWKTRDSCMNFRSLHLYSAHETSRAYKKRWDSSFFHDPLLFRPFILFWFRHLDTANVTFYASFIGQSIFVGWRTAIAFLLLVCFTSTKNSFRFLIMFWFTLLLGLGYCFTKTCVRKR